MGRSQVWSFFWTQMSRPLLPQSFTLPPRLVPATLLPPHLPLLPASQFPGSMRTSGPIVTCFNIGWRMGKAFSFLLVGKKAVFPLYTATLLKEDQLIVFNSIIYISLIYMRVNIHTHNAVPVKTSLGDTSSKTESLVHTLRIGVSICVLRLENCKVCVDLHDYIHKQVSLNMQ